MIEKDFFISKGSLLAEIGCIIRKFSPDVVGLTVGEGFNIVTGSFPEEELMRKVSMIIAACAIVALSLTLFAQGRELPPMMKEIQPTFGGITTGMRGASMSAADVAKDADKLQNLFKEVGGFMKTKNLEKGVGWANDAANAAAELSKAAKANDYEAMKAAHGAVQKQCKACHDVHREQLPDKTFKLKMQ